MILHIFYLATECEGGTWVIEWVYTLHNEKKIMQIKLSLVFFLKGIEKKNKYFLAFRINDTLQLDTLLLLLCIMSRYVAFATAHIWRRHLYSVLLRQ